MTSIKPKAFPCRCGHSKRLHDCLGVSSDIDSIWCNSAKFCDCEQYVPDNLKYLEKIYKKKNGNK